jgi:hypothetical protein
MRYFIWKYDLDGSIIGPEYPQLNRFRADISEARKDAFYDALSSRLGIPDLPIEPDLFRLKARSKATDVLSNAFGGGSLVVNERVKQILDRFDIMEHRWGPITVEHGHGPILQYWWMRWTGDEESKLVFEASDMVEYDIASDEIKGPLALRDYAELESKFAEQDAIEPCGSMSIKATRMVLRAADLDSRDMFSLGRLSPELYVSEALASELLAEQVSGVILSPATNLSIV